MHPTCLWYWACLMAQITCDCTCVDYWLHISFAQHHHEPCVPHHHIRLQHACQAWHKKSLRCPFAPLHHAFNRCLSIAVKPCNSHTTWVFPFTWMGQATPPGAVAIQAVSTKCTRACACTCACTYGDTRQRSEAISSVESKKTLFADGNSCAFRVWWEDDCHLQFMWSLHPKRVDWITQCIIVHGTIQAVSMLA